ncbi:class I SAM-dependent methyltransferase [Oceanobacillus bengalensis]|uniref:class I SAM-dependent methyltransferase n=1 Tax=Oceanobacillus bengalensis TaxID=1435466 RepID=UPI0026AE7636
MDYTYLDCLALLGVGGAHPGGLGLTKDILSKETIDKTTSVLDIGCGTGQTAAHIATQYNCQVSAIDNNRTMLEKAKERFFSLQLPIELQQANAENIPYQENVFDIVLSESVLSFTDVSKTIQEAHRVLKPNGILLAIEMTLDVHHSKKHLEEIKSFYGVPQLLTEFEWIIAFQKGGYNHINIEKHEIQFNENNADDAADFSLSEDIDYEYFTILKEHENLANVYKDILGFRIFRCSK